MSIKSKLVHILLFTPPTKVPLDLHAETIGHVGACVYSYCSEAFLFLKPCMCVHPYIKAIIHICSDLMLQTPWLTVCQWKARGQWNWIISSLDDSDNTQYILILHKSNGIPDWLYGSVNYLRKAEKGRQQQLKQITYCSTIKDDKKHRLVHFTCMLLCLLTKQTVNTFLHSITL